MFTKKCLFCRKEFQCAYSKQKYCSQECKHLADRKRIKVVCLTCGKEYEVEQGKIKRNKEFYCCRKCYLDRPKQKNKYVKKDNFYEIYLKSEKYGEKIAYIDLEDYDVVSKYFWGYTLDGNVFYARAKFNNTTITMHRLILNPKKNEIIDHKNRNGLDNRKSNIWICSSSQNARNRKLKSDNSTGYTGVSFDSRLQKYKVSLGIKDKSYHGGYFDNLDDAIKARKELENKYWK